MFGTNDNRGAESRRGCNARKNRAFQCVVLTVERVSREGKEANEEFSVLERRQRARDRNTSKGGM
jgi:hypothetical protein